MSKTDALVGSTLQIQDYRSEFYRPPYGIITPAMSAAIRLKQYKVLKVTAFSPFCVDSEHSCQNYHRVMDYYYQKIERDRGGILIFHDGYFRRKAVRAQDLRNNRHVANRSWVPRAVEEFIVHFMQQGYRFIDMSASS